MNEKEKGILIPHSSTGTEKNKILQYVGERRIGDRVEVTPVINFGQLTPEETDSLGLIMEPSGQIRVKQPVFLPSTRTVATMGNIITAQLRMVNDVCKSVAKLFKESGYEGCRTPAPFRNDKAIYRQHKRQRKHK